MLTSPIRGVSVGMAIITGCGEVSEANQDISSKGDSLIECQNSRNADPTLFDMVSGDVARLKDFEI